MLMCSFQYHFFSRLSLKWLVRLLVMAWPTGCLLRCRFWWLSLTKSRQYSANISDKRFNAIYDVLVLLQFYMERHKQTVFESLRHICYINAPKWVNNNNLMTKCRRTENEREKESVSERKETIVHNKQVAHIACKHITNACFTMLRIC